MSCVMRDVSHPVHFGSLIVGSLCNWVHTVHVSVGITEFESSLINRVELFSTMECNWANILNQFVLHIISSMPSEYKLK